MPQLAVLLLSLLSAGLYGLTFPTACMRPLAWVALVPFFLALRRVGIRGALLLGWLWTVVMAYVMGDWFPATVTRYFDQPTLVGIAFFVGTSSLMAAPEYMAFALYYRSVARRAAAATPFLVAAGWVAAELGRARLLTGNPLALIGYSQVGVEPLPQIADVTGVYGISFVVVTVNAALADVWCAVRAAGVRRRAAVSGLALAAAAVVALAGYGMLRLHDQALGGDASAVKVALIQGNCDLGSLWQPEFYGRNLDVYARLTDAAVRAHEPALVVWPESAMSFFLQTEPLYRQVVRGVLAGGRAELLAGGPRQDGLATAVYFNTIFLLSPEGRIVAAYDKQHLLPFSEYFPAGRLDFLRRRFAHVREFTPGGPTPPLPTAAGAAGIAVCNEAMFPEIVRARVRAGSEVLVNPANDTWLSPKFSAQLFDMVTLRAIEQRRYLVRVSTSGPSAVIDPLGRAVVKTTPGTEAAVVGWVRPTSTQTIYARVGDLFAWLCTTVAFAAWVRRARPGRASA